MENQAKTTTETKPKKHLIATEPDTKIIFADTVEANCDTERIILSFIQKMPFSLTDDDKGSFDGRVISQVAITWPHLVRIKNLFVKLIESNRDSVLEAVKGSLGDDGNESK